MSRPDAFLPSLRPTGATGGHGAGPSSTATTRVTVLPQNRVGGVDLPRDEGARRRIEEGAAVADPEIDEAVQTDDGSLSASSLAELLATYIESGQRGQNEQEVPEVGPLELAGRALAASLVRNVVPVARTGVEVISRRYSEAPERVVADLLTVRQGGITGAVVSTMASSLLDPAGGGEDAGDGIL